MARRSAFDRLMEGLRRAPHDYRPSIEIFPDLNVDKLAAEFGLQEEAKARAGSKAHQLDDVRDDIETRLVERVESEKKHAHEVLQDEMRTYDERLAALEIPGRFSAIERAAPACISEFKAEVATGRDELFVRRRHLVEIERELEHFREEHGLKHRTARAHGAGLTFLKWSFLALLWALESAFNGSFLAKGSEQGLVGGVSEAVGFATLNVGGAVLFAVFGARQLYHRSTFRRIIGGISVPVWFVLAFALNLALAHYREVAGTMTTEAGQQVMQRLAQSPFELHDINSWILFGVGLLFAVLAFIDGIFLVDPYPGYGALQKRVDSASRAYVGHKKALIDLLRDISESYAEQMDELSRDLSVRRSEYDAIMTHRGRLVQLFDSHQTHLERAGNSLLATYRHAKGVNPSKPFLLNRIKVSANPPDPKERDEIRETTEAAQRLLNEQNRQIHAEFESALAQYRQIDDFIPENTDDARPSQAA